MPNLNVTYNFTNGNVAEAGQVNQNFEDIEVFANTQVVRVDGAVQAPTIAIADGAITTAKIAANAVSYAKLESTVLNVLPPIASVMQFMGTAEPSGWKFCNGQTLVIANYPDLYALLTSGGTVFRYGPNPSGSTFVLPDMRHRVPVGLGSETEFDTLGEVGGSKVGIQSHDHTYSGTVVASGGHNHGGYVDNGGAHQHDIPSRTNDVGTHGHGNTSRVSAGSSSNNPTDTVSATNSIAVHTHTIPSVGDHQHTFSGTVSGVGTASGNLQPYMTVNYIIRAA